MCTCAVVLFKRMFFAKHQYLSAINQKRTAAAAARRGCGELHARRMPRTARLPYLPPPRTRPSLRARRRRRHHHRNKFNASSIERINWWCVCTHKTYLPCKMYLRTPLYVHNIINAIYWHFTPKRIFHTFSYIVS